MVAHLASGELYNQACLEGAIDSLGEWEDDEAYNVAHVARRRQLTHAQVLQEWDERATDVRERWRAMHPATPLPTSHGPYLVGLQSWHIASEYATHSDDMGVPVPEPDRAHRLAWRFAFSRYAVQECEVPVTVTETGTGVEVADGSASATLTTEQFVAAVSRRLDLEAVGTRPEVHALVRRLKVLL